MKLKFFFFNKEIIFSWILQVGKFIQLVSTFVGGFALAFVKGWLRSSSRIIYYVQKVRISHPEFAKVLEFSISLAPLRTSTTSPTVWCFENRLAPLYSRPWMSSSSFYHFFLFLRCFLKKFLFCCCCWRGGFLDVTVERKAR